MDLIINNTIVAYEIEKDRLAKINEKVRDELEHNLVSSKLNVRFYTEVILPSEEKAIAELDGKKYPAEMKSLMGQLDNTKQVLAAEERKISNTEAFLILMSKK